MAALVIDYDSLTKVANSASSLAKKAESYADDLTNKILNKFSNVSGGSTTYTSEAKYYVRQKISALQAKQASYSGLSRQITTFIDTQSRMVQELHTLIGRIPLASEAWLKRSSITLSTAVQGVCLRRVSNGSTEET